MRLLSLLLSFFLISQPLMADDNPSLMGYPDKKIMGFLGLDTNSSEPLIADGRARDLLNVKLSSALNIKKRPGIDTVNNKSLDDLDTDSPAITGIFDAEYSNGNSWTYAFVGTKIKYDNSGTWTNVAGSKTVTTGQNNQWLCTMALDKAICTNGTDTPLSIGSTPTVDYVNFGSLSNAPTKARAVAWFRNYLIFGNVTEGGTSYPTRFRWSNVGTITTWSTSDYNDISSFSGDEIQAFVEMYGDLYIFMRKSIWKATLVGGNEVFVFSKVIENTGTIAKGSVKLINLPDGKIAVIFLSEDKKVYLFNSVAIQDIGKIIQPTLNNLETSRLPYAVSEFDGFDYYLALTDDGGSKNDFYLDYQVEINEWTKGDLDINAFARVKETTSLVKTYFGNIYAIVYWFDNSDLFSDVDGQSGVLDSVSTGQMPTATGQQILVDSALGEGSWTGATIRIVSGTGVGEEQVIMTALSTGVVVAAAFTTTPDSTSNYTIGDIDAYYKTKWYDFGDVTRYKDFKSLFFWANEDASNETDLHYYKDFGSEVAQETVSLAPSSSSLWDTGLWDVATWATQGDKLYYAKLTSTARNISLEFAMPDIDKTFNIYGFHIKAEKGNDDF